MKTSKGYSESLPSGYDIFKCSECRLEFCHPMPTQEEFDACYEEYNDPRARPKVVEVNAKHNIKVLEEFGLSRESHLLDYGSGQGIFCQTGGSALWKSYDPYTEDNDKRILEQGNYDWVTLWGVLEHEAEPVDLLKKLAALLRPEGRLALTTVSIDTDIPYRHKPPEHVTYWTREALEQALRLAGFVIQRFRSYVMKQTSDVYMDAVLRTVPGHLKGKIEHKLAEMVEVPTNEVFVVAQRVS